MKKTTKVGSKAQLIKKMKKLADNQYYHANQMTLYRDVYNDAPVEVQKWLGEQELIAIKASVHIQITLRKLQG